MKKPNKKDYTPMVIGVDDYIEDLEKYCNYLENRNKQLRIGGVSQQRELLFFGEWLFDQFDLNKDVPVANILENYLKLKKNNCC